MDQLVHPNEYDSSVSAVAAVSLMAGLVRALAAAATAGLAGIDSTCTKRLTPAPGAHPVGAQREARTLAV